VKLSYIYRTVKELPDKQTYILVVERGRVPDLRIAERDYAPPQQTRRNYHRSARVKQLRNIYEEAKDLLSLLYKVDKHKVEKLFVFTIACIAKDKITSKKWKHRFEDFARITSTTYDDLIAEYPELLQTREDIKNITHNIIDTRERFHTALRHVLFQFELMLRARRSQQILTTAHILKTKGSAKYLLFFVRKLREQREQERGRFFRRLAKLRYLRAKGNAFLQAKDTTITESVKAQMMKAKAVYLFEASKTVIPVLGRTKIYTLGL